MGTLQKETADFTNISQPNLFAGGIEDRHENLEEYEVSVLCVQYNPQWEKIQRTLQSIIQQKEIKIQIVIADDGSEYDWHFEISMYLEENNFYDYVFAMSPINRGTVINALTGVGLCLGKYVKTISPGDLLIHENILKRWVGALKKSGKKWSFSEAVYYSIDNSGKKEYHSVTAHPQLLEPYKKGKESECRWNYAAMGDIALGAAEIISKDLCFYYLNLIKGRVIYADDNIYRLMMFDNVIPYYFPEKTVYYEYGTGISTNGSRLWDEKLKKDWLAANEVMRERAVDNDPTQEEIMKYWKVLEERNFVRRLVHMPRRSVFLKLKQKLLPRKTNASFQ